MDMPNDPSDSVLAPERLGQAAFVLMIPVFAYLGYVLFDDLLFGGLVGLLVGGGTFLYLPYFIYREIVRKGNVADVEGGYARRAAVGIGLASGGLVAIAMRFVFEGAILLPFAVAILYTLVIYVPLDYALPAVDDVEPHA
jgi:hypothetical protein